MSWTCGQSGQIRRQLDMSLYVNHLIDVFTLILLAPHGISPPVVYPLSPSQLRVSWLPHC